MTLQHLDNPGKEFLASSYGGEIEGFSDVPVGGCVMVFAGTRKCFTDDIETSKDEDLPATDEAFNVFAPDEVTPSGANTRGATTQCFKIGPTTFEFVPDFYNSFLVNGATGFNPLTGTRTGQCGMYGATRPGHSQSQRKVLSCHQVG